MPTPDARPTRNLRWRPMGRYPGLRFGRAAFPWGGRWIRPTLTVASWHAPWVAYRCGGSTGIAPAEIKVGRRAPVSRL